MSFPVHAHEFMLLFCHETCTRMHAINHNKTIKQPDDIVISYYTEFVGLSDAHPTFCFLRSPWKVAIM